MVKVDLEAKVDGEVLEDGVAEGVDYTIGSGELLDGIDDAVTGLEAGATATFTSELKGGSAAGQEAEVTVKVGTVSARELPALDDEFAQMASEFDTLDELREDSRKRLGQQKKYEQATEAQEKVLDALLALVDVPVPEKLLEEEVNTRKHNLVNHQLGQMGLDLATYLQMQDKSEEDFDAELKEQAEKGIRTQFVLDELVSTEKLNVSQEELTEHLMRRAQSSGMSPDQFAQAVVEGGQVPMLVGEVARGKALADRRRGGHRQGHQRRDRRPRRRRGRRDRGGVRGAGRRGPREGVRRGRREGPGEVRGLTLPRRLRAARVILRIPQHARGAVPHPSRDGPSRANRPTDLRSQRTAPAAGWRRRWCALGSQVHEDPSDGPPSCDRPDTSRWTRDASDAFRRR